MDKENIELESLRSEIQRLHEVIKWNLQNNDEYGCEFLSIMIVKEENAKLRKICLEMKETLEIYAANDLFDPHYGQRLTEPTARLIHELGDPARKMIDKFNEQFPPPGIE